MKHFKRLYLIFVRMVINGMFLIKMLNVIGVPLVRKVIKIKCAANLRKLGIKEKKNKKSCNRSFLNKHGCVPKLIHVLMHLILIWIWIINVTRMSNKPNYLNILKESTIKLNPLLKNTRMITWLARNIVVNVIISKSCRFIKSLLCLMTFSRLICWICQLKV